MPGRCNGPEPRDESWDDDPDEVQDGDWDDGDETPTVPCPRCGRPVPDFADRCHHCGDWIVQTAGPAPRRNPVFAGVVIVAVGLVLVWVVWGRMGC